MTPMNADDDFDDSVKYVDPFTIDWSISFNNGDDYAGAGSSKNPLYLTWANPIVTPMESDIIHTEIHVGCSAASGIGGKVGTDDHKVLDSIWPVFAGRSILRMSDGSVLSYYGFFDVNKNGKYDKNVDTDRNEGAKCPAAESLTLLQQGNGQCMAWTRFMLRVLKAQGLGEINGNECKIVGVQPNLKDFENMKLFIVKEWAPKQGTAAKYEVKTLKSYYSGVEGTEQEDPTKTEAYDIPGVPGQGNSPNPPSSWESHFMVWANNKYYDPSYGIGPKATAEEYEAEAFVGRIEEDPGTKRRFLYDMKTLKPGDRICDYLK